MKFLYPKSRQYPVDEVCEQIVHELEKRNWQVSGVTVEFRMNKKTYQMVDRIKGNNFHLWFYRKQGNVNSSCISTPHQHEYSVDERFANLENTDNAAIYKISIPKKQLCLYQGETIELAMYCGADWDNDQQDFIDKQLVNGYMKPRKYLRYGDSQSKEGWDHIIGERAPYIIKDIRDGVGLPQEDMPDFFMTDEVLEEFKNWLTENVLNYILAH